MKIDPLFLQAHQARKHEASAYENQLGDTIERAFGQELWELEPLVAYLNESGLRMENGQRWTTQNFQEEMKRLSN